MTEAELKQAMIECRALQQKADESVDALCACIAEIIKALPSERQYPIVEIDGEFYQLQRQSQSQAQIEVCRKYGGFFADYRLVNIGKPL